MSMDRQRLMPRVSLVMGRVIRNKAVLQNNGKVISVNPIALRKAKIVYNFGLSECSRNKDGDDNQELVSGKE